ncbi:MAG: hypothetical protein P8H25_07670 [Flavobacteriaceae bacterium]|nr:hypothetical protein [Flavobacteriaceae bacterium]
MTETLPEFLLADNADFPDAVFVVHTRFPRFVLNLADDNLEWWETLSEEDKESATEEVALWIERATAFYDNEINRYKD